MGGGERSRVKSLHVAEIWHAWSRPRVIAAVWRLLPVQGEKYRLYADILHIEWLLYYRKCLFSVLELDARYEWRVTPPNTHRSLFLISHFCVYSVLRHGPRHASVVLWYDIVCVYCKLVHTSLFGTQLRLTTKLMHLMTVYCTPNNGFTANGAFFYKNEVG